MKRSLALLLAGALVAACGGEGDGSGTTVPADPEAPVLAITGEGGFVPVEFNLDRMPRYLLTADRSLYYQGPIPEIFPGPLMPNVQVTTVSESDWDEIMALIDDLGIADLTEEVIDDSGSNMIADAPTDFINYYVDGGVRRMGFYALEFTEAGRSADRLLALELLEILGETTATNPSGEYAPTRLQVAAGPAFQEEPDLTTVEPWPLGVGFADMAEWALGWKCMQIDGEPVPGLVRIFKEADQLTLWDTGSEQVAIKARPLLPGENACGGAPTG